MEKGKGLLPLETFHYYDLTLGEKFEGGVVRTTTTTRSARSTRIIYIYDEKGVSQIRVQQIPTSWHASI
jgi:hypothetical protein